MSEIDVLRKDIDRLDKEICDLLLARFEVVRGIGEIKKRDALPVTNAGREEEVIAKVRSTATAEEDKRALEAIYRKVIEESKNLEK